MDRGDCAWHLQNDGQKAGGLTGQHSDKGADGGVPFFFPCTIYTKILSTEQILTRHVDSVNGENLLNAASVIRCFQETIIS